MGFVPQFGSREGAVGHYYGVNNQMASNPNRMTSLLGLLAVAGWQNRDKLAGMFASLTGQTAERPENPAVTSSGPDSPRPASRAAIADNDSFSAPDSGSMPSDGQTHGGVGDLLGNLGGLLGGATAAGGGLGGALNDLLGQFSATGHREEAESWIGTGPNRAVGKAQLEEALGPETLRQLAERTGLSREELSQRLSTILPTAVDTLTPEGRVPTREEEARWAKKLRAA
jgi:uncharacterized protein YidB (DUF937 family)